MLAASLCAAGSRSRDLRVRDPHSQPRSPSIAQSSLRSKPTLTVEESHDSIQEKLDAIRFQAAEAIRLAARAEVLFPWLCVSSPTG
mgnify:CR=1 FL=1